MEKLDERAQAARVRDLAGREVELRSLWAERPAVLAFLRHFG
jgi:hypothetical protein